MLVVLVVALVVQFDLDEIDGVLVPVHAEYRYVQAQCLEEGVVQIDLADILLDLVGRQPGQERLQGSLRVDRPLADLAQLVVVLEMREIHGYLGFEVVDVRVPVDEVLGGVVGRRRDGRWLLVEEFGGQHLLNRLDGVGMYLLDNVVGSVRVAHVGAYLDQPGGDRHVHVLFGMVDRVVVAAVALVVVVDRFDRLVHAAGVCGRVHRHGWDTRPELHLVGHLDGCQVDALTIRIDQCLDHEIGASRGEIQVGRSDIGAHE